MPLKKELTKKPTRIKCEKRFMKTFISYSNQMKRSACTETRQFKESKRKLS
jgi:hypothetical protein